MGSCASSAAKQGVLLISMDVAINKPHADPRLARAAFTEESAHVRLWI